MTDYYLKYIKYKTKYLKLKGGSPSTMIGPINLIFYKDINEKNILMLGDFHDDLDYDKKCCLDKELEKNEKKK